MGEKEKMEIEVVSDDSLGDVEIIKVIRDDGTVLSLVIDLEKDADELVGMGYRSPGGRIAQGFTDVGKLRAFFRTTE